MTTATLGYWLCRRRPWLTLFWVAGSIVLPLLALLAAADPGTEPVGSYRIVASVTLAAGVVFPVLGAVAGGLRFWSEVDTMAARQPTAKPGRSQASGPARNGKEPKVAKPGPRPGNDA